MIIHGMFYFSEKIIYFYTFPEETENLLFFVKTPSKN